MTTSNKYHTLVYFAYAKLEVVMLAIVGKSSLTGGIDMDKDLNKSQKLLLYLISKHSKPTVTSLMKLCYIADLIFVKDNPKQISGFSYIRYTFGPFDEQIYADLEDLSKKGLITGGIEYGAFGDGIETVVYHPVDKAEVLLTVEEKSTVDEVFNALGGHSAKSLTEIAYKTKPMLKLGATLGGTENIGTKLDLKAS
jgi:uncharacterized phage-associated protein